MKKHVSLSIAISDTSISTALIERAPHVSKHPSKKPLIATYRFKKINPRYQDLSAPYLESRIILLLKEVLHDTRYTDIKQGGYKISDVTEVMVSLSAPWYDNKTVISHFKEARPFKITEGHMRKAVDSEIKAVRGNDSLEVSILESVILSSTLNGYTVSDPIGKSAHELTVNGYVSYIKTPLKTAIEGVIVSFFSHIRSLVMKSESSILLQAALQERAPRTKKEEFVIIRINEILTHMQVVAHGHLREVGTIPLGLNSVLIAIEESCNVTREVAESVLSLYTQKKLEHEFSLRVTQIIEKSLGAWRDAIKEFSNTTISTGRFPSEVYLSAPRSVSHVFKNYLLEDNYLDLTLSESKLSITILDKNTPEQFVDVRPGISYEPGFLTKLNAMI